MSSFDAFDLIRTQRELNGELVLASLRAHEESEAAASRGLLETAELRERLLAILGHDLRTPLGAITMSPSRSKEGARKHWSEGFGSRPSPPSVGGLGLGRDALMLRVFAIVNLGSQLAREFGVKSQGAGIPPAFMLFLEDALWRYGGVRGSVGLKGIFGRDYVA